MRRPARHIRARFVTTVGVVAVLIVLFPFFARPADAILGFGDITFNTTVEDIPRKLSEGVQKALDVAKNRLKDSVAIAFKNAARQFLANATQQFATSLATTQPGQKPLFLTNPKTFFRDVADAAAGDFIDDFTRGVTGGRWDERCDSKEAAIRAQCTGITGGTAGLGGPLSGQRGRFIISRLLRAGVDGALNTCKEQFAVTNTTPIGDIKSQKPLDRITSVSDIVGYNNAHEQKVAYAQAWLDLTTQMSGVKETQDTVIVCHGVSDRGAGAVGPVASDPYWSIVVGQCPYSNPSSAPAECTATAIVCQNRQEEAILNERQQASKEYQVCQKKYNASGLSDVQKLVDKATATDVFSYVENFDIRRSPKLIAASFKGNSDISQYFQAAALLTASVQTQVTGNQTYLNAGLLPRTSKVSEKVLTPKEAGSALFGIPFYNNQGELTYTGTGAADIIRAVASFVNSPVGKALFTYFRSRCGVNPDACAGPKNAQSEVGKILFGTGGPTGLAAAQIQFAGLGKVDLINGNPGKNEIDVLGQLTSSGLIDPQFRTAVDEGLTVKEAMDRGLISSKKIVGYDRSGVEASDGYPFRSLQYLRKYRILPVGWELAAKYAYNFRTDDLTLATLTSQYNICGQDNQHLVCSETLKSCSTNNECQSGETCGASPYCGLVDPNWVLKAPQTYCRRQGAGEEIVSKEYVCDINNVRKTDGAPLDPNIQDAQDQGPANCVQDDTRNPNPDIGRWVISRNTSTCADSQSCIAEADDGTCLAYGYCVQERQVFKFDGTSCQAQNVSCASYTNAAGQEFSYLSKNLDTNCSADVAGCQWYCAKPSYDETRKAWTCTTATNATGGSKVHLTGQVQSCSASQVGCQQFIRMQPGTNLLQNGGFEYYQLPPGGLIDVDPAAFPGWSATAATMSPVTPTDSAFTSSNQTAVRLRMNDANETIRQSVNLASSPSERSFSFSVRAMSATACDARLTICTGVDCASSGLAPSVVIHPTTTWDSYTVSMNVPAQADLAINTTYVTAVLQPSGCATSGLVVDSAQLEEGSVPTSFTDYGSTNLVYLNASRRACQSADVGCEKYTPVAGGAAVNGIIGTANTCSKDQVGCQLTHREPITTLPYRDYNPTTPATAGADVTIIPTSGQSCAAADVGCEEYTNLDQVRQGGEGKAYFKAIKQCVQPTNTSVTKSTYYTWIGDPEKGFVLQSQQLVKSNLGGGPCMNLSVATGSADPVCEDTAATVSSATCAAGDLSDNPDCAEYYDQNLSVYYRLRSKTVSVTADCHPFRNTIDETEYASTNAGRVYYLSTKENTSCQAAAAGCRAFTGNTGRTSRQVVRDTFESSTLRNWVGGTWSAAAPNAGSHSIKIDPLPTNSNGVAFTTVDSLRGKLNKGKSYLLTVTAAAAVQPAANSDIFLQAYLGTGNDVSGQFDPLVNNDGIGFQSDQGARLVWNTSITPSGPEWHTYTLGPVTLGDTINPEWRLGIVIRNGSGYVDSLTLTEISDRTYLVNNTASQCTQIGCTAYKDRKGNLAYATAFQRLCSDTVVGCEAMIDTQNSLTPFTQTVKGVTTPADQIVTVVNDPATYCPATAKGCSMYGEPTIGRDETLTNFTTVYLRNDPDRYQADLCAADGSEDSCEAFTTSEGTPVYFKAPELRTCEYRSGGAVTGGWFITGTTIKCPVVTPPAVGQPVGSSCSQTCIGGSRDGKACTLDSECPAGACLGDPTSVGRILNAAGESVLGSCGTGTQCAGTGKCSNNPSVTCTQNGDCGGTGSTRCVFNQCHYLVGICPAEENGCTEYRDPTDPESCRSECPLELMGGTPVNVDANCVKTVCTSPDPNNQRIGQNCANSSECTYAGIPGTCVGENTNLPTTGAPGCRAYYYVRQSLVDTAGICNGQVNTAIGCRAFNDTSNPTLNFRGQ